MYFEVKKKGKAYWVRIRAANHRIKYASETFEELATARRTAAKDAKALGLKLVDRTK